MKNQLSARSPFWQLIFMVHTIIMLIAYALSDRTLTAEDYTVGFPDFFMFTAASLVIFVILGSIVVSRYNRRNPGKKMSIWQVAPPEIIMDDERSGIISANATRAVYLYGNIAWPVVAVAVAMFQSAPLALVFIGAAMAGHYIVYWYHIRTLLEESE